LSFFSSHSTATSEIYPLSLHDALPICDGFDPAMGVPGEPGEVILGVLVTKVVEQEKGIEFFGVAKAERAAQPHAGALDGRLRLHNSLDWSNGHDGSSDSQVAALW